MFATYTLGQTDVANWLHRTDLTSYIADFIRMGELRIYRDLRIRAMEASLSTAIASGVIAVPSGYIALKSAYIDGTPIKALERKDAEWIQYNYPTRSADGKPAFIARSVDNFIFGPYPDSTYTVKGTYYKRLDALTTTTNETNWFTINAPDLLLFASLCEAGEYAQDERLPAWEAKYDAIGQRIQREDTAEEFSGSPLSISVR